MDHLIVDFLQLLETERVIRNSSDGNRQREMGEEAVEEDKVAVCIVSGLHENKK